MNRFIFFEADKPEEEKTNRKKKEPKFSSIQNIRFFLAPKIGKIIFRDSSKFRSHPGDDLHNDPGARLLQHGHGQVVGDALQAVPVHGQQTIAASAKNEKKS